MFAFRIARRAFVKLFGIVGFLLALVGGALIGYSAANERWAVANLHIPSVVRSIVGTRCDNSGSDHVHRPNAVRRIPRRDRRNHTAPHNQLRHTSYTRLRGRNNRIGRSGNQTALVEVLEALTRSS